MTNKNITLRQLRLEQYKDKISDCPYINNWKKNPYTFLKARLYMESSAVLVYFLLKTRIKPNTLSIIYGLLGLAGGILLAISTNKTVFIAIFIFFLKAILDWSDGHLARIKNQTSITGVVLDPYGALLGTLGFQVGLGLYVAQKSGMMLFYYLTLLIPLFYAANLISFGYKILFQSCLKSEELKEYRTKSEKTHRIANKKKSIFYNLIKNFLDDHAKTVDFVCLLLLLEIFTSIFITWVVFLGFVARHFLLFSASFYIVAKGGWAEKKVEDKIRDLSI